MCTGYLKGERRAGNIAMSHCVGRTRRNHEQLQPFIPLSLVVINDRMAPTHPDASFLGPPPELCLRLYDLLIAEQDLCLRPVPQSKVTRTGCCHHVWALALVCTLVRCEITPLLPKIPSLTLELYGFTEAAVETWLKSTGPRRTPEIRRLNINGMGNCCAGKHNEHYPSEDDCEILVTFAYSWHRQALLIDPQLRDDL